MKKIVLHLLLLLIFFGFIACEASDKEPDLANVEFMRLSNSDSILTALVLSPAGTQLLYNYDVENDRILIGDSIHYMPLPINEGFIIGSINNGEPIRCLIMGPMFQSGRIIKIIPIALMHRNFKKESRKWVLAIPEEKHQQIVSAMNLQDLMINNQSILVNLENWFSNFRNGESDIQILWTSEMDALDLIEKTKIE